MFSLSERKPWVAPAVVAALTFVCHLIYGVWFWTASPTNAPKGSIKLVGEAYLACSPSWDTDHEGDSAYYNRGAVEALRTGVPRTRSGMFFEHAPVYAYFVAACYKVGGIRLLSVVLAQAFLSGLTAFFLGMAATRLAPRHAHLAGASAALLVLCNLRLAGFVGLVNPTIPLLFFFAVGLWSAATCGEKGLKPLFFVMMILAIYTQAAFFVVAMAVFLWVAYLFWCNRSVGMLVGGLCLALCAVSKPLLSMVLNHAQESSAGAYRDGVLWEANNPYYESMSCFSLWERRPGNPWTDWHASDLESRRYDEYINRAGGNVNKAALLWIRENPGQYLKLCLVRFRAVMGPVTGQMSPLNRKISTLTWLLIFPPGIYALWRYRGSRLVLLAWAVMFFEVSFESMVLAGWQPRYRLPVDLTLIIFAGVLYADLIGGWFCRVPAPTAASGVAPGAELSRR